MKLDLSAKTKNILWGAFALALIAVFIVMMLEDPALPHIGDTNGADNYSLQTITKQDIIEQKMGSRGSISESQTHFEFEGFDVSDGIKYSSRKFTGVYLLHSETLFKGSDIYVSLAEYEIKEGNFAFFILFDGEVVGQLTPNESGISEFTLENVEKTGTLEYVIAGESASFSFTAPTDF